jgi:hypothetical protein
MLTNCHYLLSSPHEGLGRGHNKETGNRNAVFSICVAPFSNMCSTQADNNSWKLRLRCGCHFLWCALALTVKDAYY